MNCPKCGSENVQIQMIETGSKTKKSGKGLGDHIHNANRAVMGLATLGLSNLVIKKAVGNEKTSNKLKKLAICQECGKSWNV